MIRQMNSQESNNGIKTRLLYLKHITVVGTPNALHIKEKALRQLGDYNYAERDTYHY